MPLREIIKPLSLFRIPLSMIEATTRGTISSKMASSILKSGAKKDSFL